MYFRSFECQEQGKKGSVLQMMTIYSQKVKHSKQNALDKLSYFRACFAK
jgi:hypothetical protein